jgi:two-component system, response regulator PdtaR
MTHSPLRIAIADDEVDMRDFLSKVLPRLGHQVVAVAADGDELIALCRESRPDLIITDLKMPHRDGLSAIEELWREQSVPVIFISAYPGELTGSPIARSPLTTVLVKPVKSIDLEPAIRHAATGGTPPGMP